jgi:hypothetical protein
VCVDLRGFSNVHIGMSIDTYGDRNKAVGYMSVAFRVGDKHLGVIIIKMILKPYQVRKEKRHRMEP